MTKSSLNERLPEGVSEESSGFDPAIPYAAAQQIAAARFSVRGVSTLRFWRGEFWLWRHGAYRPYSIADLRTMCWEVCNDFMHAKAKRRHVDEILDALRAVVNLSNGIEPPQWLDTIDSYVIRPVPAQTIVFRNGVLSVPERKLYPPAPEYFTLTALPFDWKEDEMVPVAWFKFLSDLFGDDGEKKNLLREFMGALLVNLTGFDKILFLLGPRRSGKGTILEVVAGIVGDENVTWPGIASLGTQFGTAALIGMRVAIFSDVRVPPRGADQAVAIENLLRMSGNEPMSIARKHKEDYKGKLNLNVLMAGNEMMHFHDSSGALPGRFVILPLDRSFFGREDTTLKSRLRNELPGILHWALDGLGTLTERGSFTLPESSGALLKEMEELASPVAQFVSDCCVVNDPAASIPCHLLYARWKEWCADQGRDRVGTVAMFGRDLRAAFPRLKVTQPRESGGRVRHYEGIRLRGSDEQP